MVNLAYKANIAPKALDYLDPATNWRRITWHLKSADIAQQLRTDFHKYGWGRFRRSFDAGQHPCDFDCSSWQCEHVGRKPAYFKYTCPEAAFWLVNTYLMVAQRIEPTEPWRIVTKEDGHSTVWNGGRLLFDLNYLALGLPAQEALQDAFGKELKVGELVKTYSPVHYSRE